MSGARIVYSTGQGRRCPECGRPAAECRCQRSKPAVAPAARGDGIVRVGRETKGRRGKGVSVVTGLALGEAELGALATELKRACGSGGTVRDGVIEIQGDHREQLVTELTRRGFKARRAGG